MTLQVYAPAIYLFAYHLYKTPNPHLHTDKLKPHQLWDQCQVLFKKFGILQTLNIVDHNSAELRVELLPKPLTFVSQIPLNGLSTPPVKLEGFAYPLRIYDSYALGWEIYRPALEDDGQTKTAAIDIPLLSKLNPDNCLLPDFIDSSLGQTLLFTAELTENQKRKGKQNPEFIKELADQCLAALISEPSKRPQFYHQGQLFGSPIFEYGLVSQPGIYRHVLIWLFSESQTEKLLEHHYQNLLDLWFYRNKIIRAFQQSREGYLKTYQAYEELENLIYTTFKTLPQGARLHDQDLENLNQQLKDLPTKALDYTQLLKTLESQHNTIDLNAKNYHQKLKEMDTADLIFLERFYQENCPHYQQQIQGDLNYFQHGSGMVDRAIATIRGIVEIEQAKRDQRLQDAVLILTVLGVGIGAGSIFDSSYTALYEKQPFVLPGQSFAPHPVTKSICYSFIFGAVVGLVTLLLIQLYRRRFK